MPNTVLADKALDFPVVTAAQLPALVIAPKIAGAGQLAAWRQIEAALKAPIAGAAWVRGTRLPTEVEMAAHFQVNRHTVRRAIGALVDDGFLMSMQGRGVFVAGGPKFGYRLGMLPTIGPQIVASGQTHSSMFLEASVEACGEHVGECLELGPRLPVHRVMQVERADDVAIATVTFWVPHTRFVGFADAFRKHGALDLALHAVGVREPQTFGSKLGARGITKKEAALLRIGQPAHVLTIEQVVRDGAHPRPVALAQTALIVERAELIVDDNLLG